MKKIKLIALLMAAGLVACSSDDEAETLEAKRPIIVNVAENPLVDTSADVPQRGMTRTAEYITTESLAGFSMNYQGNKYDFTKNKNTNDWSSSPDSWPDVDNGVKIDFYAYSGGLFQYNSDDPYVTFTVEEGVTDQHDLLVAEHKKIAYSDAEGHVNLTFDHACAAVLFNVQITDKLRTDKLSGSDLTVSSIVLKNVSNAGRYYYNTKSWEILSGSADYTLFNVDLTVTTTPQALSCGYLFLIPQTRTANGTTGTYLEVNYTTSTAKTATIPLSINWKAGELYTVNIKLGTTTIDTES